METQDIQDRFDKVKNKRLFKPPTCINRGCNNLCHVVKKDKKGVPRYRLVCSRCHKAGRGIGTYAKGVKPYKKDYCENKDGRLGFKCKAVIKDSCQLEMDHIDGNRNNNKQKNVQTLCANCHSWKTKHHEDGNGRKYRRAKR